MEGIRMKHLILLWGCHIRLAVLVVFSLTSFTALSQITPSGPVTVGSTVTYTYDDGNIYIKRNWQITNGTINSTSFSGTSNSCSVTWSSTCGTGTLTFRNLTTVISTASIAISPSSVSTPTGTFSVNRCRITTVTRNSSPPACTLWYWQTTASGTSMANSTNTYTLTASDWLYLRAYTDYSGWSTSSLSAGHIAAPIDPGAPTAGNASRCGTGTVSISATPATNSDNIKWYTAASGGTAVYTGTTYVTPSISATTTYYAASFNTTETCESLTRTAVVATVYTVPNAAATSQWICSGLPTSIAISNPNSVTPPPTYSWTVSQSNVTGASNGGNNTIAQTLTASANEGTATYTVTPSSNGCAGTPINVVATVTKTPVVTVTSGPGSLVYGVATTLSTTSFYSYQWKNSIGDIGGATSTSYTVPTPSTYKVNIKSSAGSPWCLSAPFAIAQSLAAQGASVDMVSTTTIFKEGVTAATSLYSLQANELAQVNQYADGLGRVFQTVATGAAPNQGDLVSHKGYGKDGFQDSTFLPYATSSPSGAVQRFAVRNSMGSYTQSDQYLFYQGTTKVATDNRPFALTKYRNSPDARVTEQGAPGRAWHPDSAHTVRNLMTVNTTSYPVRLWKSDGTTSGNYTAKTIVVAIVTDENGNKVRTYANKLGQTVLKQVQLDETIGGGTVNWLDTYYVYDNFGRLKWQVPPKAVAILDSDPSLDGDANLAELIYKYTYDDKGRLVEKKEPGAVAKLMIYDLFDRLVLTQDGTMQSMGKWAYVKYDQYGRTVYTGLYKNSRSRASVQKWVEKAYTASSTPYPEANYVEDKLSGLDSLHGYSNVSFPKDSILRLAVSYYDNYDFNTNGTPPFTYDNAHLSGIPTTASANVRGMATGSKRRLLSATGNVTANWIKGAVFYDSYDRVIQTQSNNHLDLNAVDKQSVLYNAIRRVQKTKSSHTAASVTTHINQWNDYDHAGRVLKTYHQIDTITPVIVVAQYEYNALGQLVDKKLHDPSTGNFLQSVDYRYNIRGWLSSINNSQLTSDSGTTNDETNDYFGMELAYNTGAGMSNSLLYNGNVSALKWKTLGEASGTAGQRSYKYAYDKSDKLKTSTFQANTGSAWTKEANTLNETMTYDHGGNMVSLLRKKNARTLGGTNVATAMDDLAYTYTTNTNTMVKVEDAGTTDGFTNGAVNGSAEYTYTSDGSLNRDENKGVSSTTYNFLGKPQVVNFTNGKKIEYVYDAAGIKLTVKTWQGTTFLTSTNYVGGFVYEGSTPAISFFSSPEGRVVKNGANYEYQYAIADHQGNTRVLFTSATPAPQSYTATFEDNTQTAEQANFQNYPSAGNRSGMNLYDNTDNGTTYTYSDLLNGGYNSQVGLAKSFKVYPGDKVRIQAYAKYYDNTGSSNLNGFATALLSAFALSAPGGGEVGTPSAGVNSWGSIVAGGSGKTNEGYPKAFVNLLVFDKKYNFLDLGFDGINGGHQVGVSPDVDHDYMMQEYTAREEGYIYVYLSNENPTLVDVYFDDVTVTLTRTNVIQSNEYYPYGLQTASSWTRESNTGNNFLYNGGTELNQTTQVYDLYYRNYDPALGRFGQVDPMAGQFASLTPYNYGNNDPVFFNDPLGDCAVCDSPVAGPHDTSDPNRMYRGSDPYGSARSRWLYADMLERATYRKDMEADAEDVKSGSMSQADYAAKYGEQRTISEGMRDLVALNWSILASSNDLILALTRYIGMNIATEIYGPDGINSGVHQKQFTASVGNLIFDQRNDDDQAPEVERMMLYSSTRTDIFAESIKIKTQERIVLNQTIVGLSFNKSGKKLTGMSGYGRTITYSNGGTQVVFSRLSISRGLGEYISFIEGNRGKSVSAMGKYWDFIWSREKTFKNRLSAVTAKHY